jgi:hypothetical protein
VRELGAQRVRSDGRLVAIVLAAVDEHLAGPKPLVDARDDWSPTRAAITSATLREKVLVSWKVTGVLRVRGLDRVRLQADLTVLAKLACALSRRRAVTVAA